MARRIVSTVGIVKEIIEELVVEWTIPQYSTLSRKVDDCYHSPEFPFLGNCYYLRIYCNGESKQESEGHTGLYLMVKQIRTPLSISITFAFKNASGGLEYYRKNCPLYPHPNEGSGRGFAKFCENSDIALRSNEIFLEDVLTVHCSLMNRRFHEASLLDRLLNVSRSMMDILEGEHRTDVVLKVADQEIQAHRVILEARSEVFQKMLSHDMLENRTGEIKIGDMKADVFQEVLAYMYGGIAKVTPGNASSLYIAADRFNMKELKTLCLEFMKENMSDDLFCDAYVVAEMYNETDLMRISKEYIGKNAKRIVGTEKWKKFAAEDPLRALQILTTFATISS